MNSKIIYFKIENKNCTEKGYVELYNEDDDYMPDWYYWKNGLGYVQQEIVEHKKEEITGLTYEQLCEIEYFKELVNNVYVDTILEFIFMADEDEFDEMEIGGLTVKVGDEF